MQIIKPVLNKLRFNELTKRYLYPDFEKEFVEIYYKYQNLTMTTPERMYALYKATKYVISRNIPGDIVECGVWRGGSAMLCAKVLSLTKDIKRKLYLYDTYKGMSKPSDKDTDYLGEAASKIFNKSQKENFNSWCHASLEEVKRNLYSTGLSGNQLLFVEGKVERTIPRIIPKKISLLRLDTDFYESTYHELTYLYPRLSKYGVLIIDDYGYWKGAREAVEKYFKENNIHMFLNRLDYTGRLGIKE